MTWIEQPWPWYVTGPVIGLVVPLLLLIGNRRFGISSSLRHVCAVTFPGKLAYLSYDWKRESWNLLFVVGVILGAFLASTFMPNPDTVEISEKTRTALAELGVQDRDGLVPVSIFSWHGLMTLQGLVMIVVGGFLVGFGTRYADGCTSGHAIMGLANFEKSGLVAAVSFFAGGLLITHAIYPLLFR